MPGVGVSIPGPPAGVAAPHAGVAPMPPAPYAGVAPPATIAGVASQRLRLPAAGVSLGPAPKPWPGVGVASQRLRLGCAAAPGSAASQRLPPAGVASPPLQMRPGVSDGACLAAGWGGKASVPSADPLIQAARSCRPHAGAQPPSPHTGAVAGALADACSALHHRQVCTLQPHPSPTQVLSRTWPGVASQRLTAGVASTASHSEAGLAFLLQHQGNGTTCASVNCKRGGKRQQSALPGGSSTAPAAAAAAPAAAAAASSLGQQAAKHHSRFDWC